MNIVILVILKLVLCQIFNHVHEKHVFYVISLFVKIINLSIMHKSVYIPIITFVLAGITGYIMRLKEHGGFFFYNFKRFSEERIWRWNKIYFAYSK